MVVALLSRLLESLKFKSCRILVVCGVLDIGDEMVMVSSNGAERAWALGTERYPMPLRPHSASSVAV